MPVPLFGIITVTFQAERHLDVTAASVRAQRCSDSHWLVKDGGSTDGTVDLARRHAPDALIVDADRGIYDAMNQAAAQSPGEWLFFLNAGDAFADADVLADVAAAIAAHPAAEIVYGDVVYRGARGDRRRRFHWLTRRRLLFGDLCHQAVFVRSTLFARIGRFDDRLRWNADFDWFIRAFRAGARLHYLPRDIALFDDAGAHVQAGARSETERDAVRARYLPLPLWRLGHWALRAELKLRRLAGQTV